MTTTETPGAGTTLTAPGQTPPPGLSGEGRPGGGGHAWRPPVPEQPTREELILSALDYAAEYLRQTGDCGDCVLDVGNVTLCGDHAPEAELAKAFDALYAEILAGEVA